MHTITSTLPNPPIIIQYSSQFYINSYLSLITQHLATIPDHQTSNHRPIIVQLKLMFEICLIVNYKLETKAMTTSSHCNTGRTCLPLPIATRENTYLAIHVVQKMTIIRAHGKFAVWNLMLCTGAIWRRREKFEYGCTTTYHPYKKPQNIF